MLIPTRGRYMSIGVGLLSYPWMGTPRPENRIGQRYNPHTFSFIHNQPKAPLEDEGQEEMFMKLIAATASAQDFVVDGICYNILSEDDRTVEVTESPYGYSGDVVIPAEVTYDGSTYSVTTIGDEAFYDCALRSVSMPEVTTIGNWAFGRCDDLTSVEMPSVMTIGSSAFYDCYHLGSVDMPSVTTIGDYAFSLCDDLKSKSMPAVTTIGSGAFESCNALTSVSMPSVMTIGYGAFSSCDGLKSIYMPSVTTIGEYAFNNCSSLIAVFMPSVTTIGVRAFWYCSALTSVDIPASVKMIGNYAFEGCSGLTSVYCHWEQPLECDPRFDEMVLATATLYVPDGCVDAYRAVKPWSWFFNIVEGGYSGIANATAPEVVIKVIDGAISIDGTDGTASAPMVEVYSAGGVCVYRGTNSSIGGLGHGVYVVKVGDTVQKVAL